MDWLCRTCDQFINDEYSINNPNLNDIDKIINNYVVGYNKKLYNYMSTYTLVYIHVYEWIFYSKYSEQ